MGQFWLDFIATFIPLFIAVDTFGNLPIIITLSEGLTKKQHHRMINIGIGTATVVGVIFLFFGQLILNAMGIPVGAFTISGGLILLILSLRYILQGRSIEGDKQEMMAVVPIGTPLVVGPATITTLLLLAIDYPLYVIMISLALNLIISWVVFILSNRIAGFLGKGGIRALSQIFNLLLAAIAVNMIFRGLQLVGVIK